MAGKAIQRTISFCLLILAGCITKPLPEIPATSFSPHTDAVYCIAYSPDGQQIATGHFPLDPQGVRVQYASPPRGYVRLWSAELSGESGFIAGGQQDEVAIPTFAKDGSLIVHGTKELMFCDPTGAIRERREILRPFALDADHQLVACLTDDAEPTRVVVRNLEGACLSGELHNPTGKSLSVGMVRAFSPDGQLLATSPEWAGNEVLIWDWARGLVVDQFDHSGRAPFFHKLAFSKSSSIVATIHSENEIRLRDIKSRQLVHSFRQDRGHPYDLCFSSDDRLLVLCGEGDSKEKKKFGFLIVWDVESGQQLASIKRSDVWGITAIEFSPDGQTLAAGLSNGSLVTYSRQDLLK